MAAASGAGAPPVDVSLSGGLGFRDFFKDLPLLRLMLSVESPDIPIILERILAIGTGFLESPDSNPTSTDFSDYLPHPLTPQLLERFCNYWFYVLPVMRIQDAVNDWLDKHIALDQLLLSLIEIMPDKLTKGEYFSDGSVTIYSEISGAIDSAATSGSTRKKLLKLSPKDDGTYAVTVFERINDREEQVTVTSLSDFMALDASPYAVFKSEENRFSTNRSIVMQWFLSLMTSEEVKEKVSALEPDSHHALKLFVKIIGSFKNFSVYRDLGLEQGMVFLHTYWTLLQYDKKSGAFYKSLTQKAINMNKMIAIGTNESYVSSILKMQINTFKAKLLKAFVNITRSWDKEGVGYLDWFGKFEIAFAILLANIAKESDFGATIDTKTQCVANIQTGMSSPLQTVIKLISTIGLKNFDVSFPVAMFAVPHETKGALLDKITAFIPQVAPKNDERVDLSRVRYLVKVCVNKHLVILRAIISHPESAGLKPQSKQVPGTARGARRGSLSMALTSPSRVAAADPHHSREATAPGAIGAAGGVVDTRATPQTSPQTSRRGLVAVTVPAQRTPRTGRRRASAPAVTPRSSSKNGGGDGVCRGEGDGARRALAFQSPPRARAAAGGRPAGVSVFPEEATPTK